MKTTPGRTFYRLSDGQQRVLSLEPSFSQSGQSLLRIAPSGEVYGPFLDPQPHLDAIAQELLQQGFRETDLGAWLQRLVSGPSRQRAQAARALVRLARSPDQKALAAQAMVQALPQAIDESCSLLDALGDLGQAAPAVLECLRAYAGRKLLSRRRSAVEALRKLKDAQGLAEILTTPIPHDILQQPASERGRLLDLLYELDDPAGNQQVRQLLPRFPLPRKDVWRYLKSILKRALLRGDSATVVSLAHLLDTTPGQTQKFSLKSGYDGQTRLSHLYSPKTRVAMLRLCWNHLQKSPDYALWAAQILVAYTPQEVEKPQSLYLWQRLLYGGHTGLILDQRRLRYRGSDPHLPPSPSFPERWQAQPRAYLSLLTGGKTPAVQRLAQQVLSQEHPELLEQASSAQLLPALDAPWPASVQLVARHLVQRPLEWATLERLCQHSDPEVAAWGATFLEENLLELEPQQLQAALHWPPQISQPLALWACQRLLATWSREQRQKLAQDLWSQLTPGADPIALVLGQGLLDQLDWVKDLEVQQWLGSDWPLGLALGVKLLGRRPQMLRQLEPSLQGKLLDDGQAEVRAQMRSLLPAGLATHLLLLESRWPDNRHFALERLAPLKLDFTTVAGLCDSSFAEVRQLGLSQLEWLRPEQQQQIIENLLEHPQVEVRGRWLEHWLQQLPLEKLQGTLRAVLFDLQPRASHKTLAIDYLLQQGLKSREQAHLASPLLHQVSRSWVGRDAEAAILALTQLALQFPDLDLPLKVSA